MKKIQDTQKLELQNIIAAAGLPRSVFEPYEAGKPAEHIFQCKADIFYFKVAVLDTGEDDRYTVRHTSVSSTAPVLTDSCEWQRVKGRCQAWAKEVQAELQAKLKLWNPPTYLPKSTVAASDPEAPPPSLCDRVTKAVAHGRNETALLLLQQHYDACKPHEVEKSIDVLLQLALLEIVNKADLQGKMEHEQVLDYETKIGLFALEAARAVAVPLQT
jgi:hypothetical protein